MASSTQHKIPCSTCSKATGILTCRGCGKDFCYRHVAEHREELNKQMDEMTTNHDQLQQTITEQQAQPQCHPIMKKIDLWEEDSIEKIRQVANRAREQLLIIADKHRTRVTNALGDLTQELTKARNDDDYVETDLKEWREKLEKLKKDLATKQAIDFCQVDDDASLIPKIIISDMLSGRFETWFGDIQVTDSGKLFSHGRSNQFASVRGNDEYSSGHHIFRFKIEQLPVLQGLYFGITSKNTSVESFLSNHTVFAAIRPIHSGLDDRNIQSFYLLNGYNYSIQVNDILELIIDCDQQMIRCRNERLGTQDEFKMNVDRCPFPWRIVLGLSRTNDCVRLC